MSKLSPNSEFVGHHLELSLLQNLYQKTQKESQILFLSGQKQVGKTTFIQYFYDKKPHIYFYCNSGSKSDQLSTIVKYFSHEFEDSSIKKSSLNTWEKFFEYLNSKLKPLKVPLIIVLDEFQNLVSSDKNIYNTLTQATTKSKNTLIVLISADKQLAVECNLAKNNHKTTFLVLPQLNLATVKQMFGPMDFDKLFSLYAIVGGLPSYLTTFNPKKTLKENILKKLLDRKSFIYSQIPLLMASLFADPKVYLTVLKAIGIGNLSFADLIKKTSLKSNQLSVYLNKLIRSGLVTRVNPVTTLSLKNSKKGLYFITDHFCRFYFSFVFPNLTQIEAGNTELVYKHNLQTINKLISQSYQEVGQAMVLNLIDQQKLPHFEHLGRWWKGQQVISWVGFNQNNHQAVFVDSIWSNKNIGLEEYKKLKNKAKLVTFPQKILDKYFVLISNSGFTNDLIKMSKIENLLLVKQDQLV